MLGLRPLALLRQKPIYPFPCRVTPQDKPMKIDDIRVDGTVSDANIDGLPLDQHLQEGALVISVADGETGFPAPGVYPAFRAILIIADSRIKT